MATTLLTFHGDVGAEDFPLWIVHRARRMGLHGWVRPTSDGTTIRVLVSGPDELIDAMELVCSLGPMSVWVEHVERTPANEAVEDTGFNVLSEPSAA